MMKAGGWLGEDFLFYMALAGLFYRAQPPNAK